MAKFTKAQVDNAKWVEIKHWNHKGGWDDVTNITDTPSSYILSKGIYLVYANIDGETRKFYSKGAKEYGTENLD